MNINPLDVAFDEDPDNMETPYWLHKPCPEWCTKHHNQYDYGSDRQHFSEWSHNMWLTLEEPTRHDFRDAEGRIEYSPYTMSIYLIQGDREVEPRIAVEEQFRRLNVTFTLAEARQVASALSHAVELTKRFESPATAQIPLADIHIKAA